MEQPRRAGIDPTRSLLSIDVNGPWCLNATTPGDALLLNVAS